MNLRSERNRAMLRARQAAYDGKAYLAQIWINRANSFYPVSSRQVRAVQKFLDLARRLEEVAYAEA